MDRARQSDLLAPLAATSRRGKRAKAPARQVPSTRTLAIVLSPDGSPPTEFRLFVSGWNDTENGRFLFDAEAASAVMAAHEKWGVDLMIDLEHQALNSGTPPDPTARDARGWFRLELRSDGSLWATGVTWTPDGAQRLAEKRQRYVSPAFSVDPETSRVTSIINCALVAIPATHDTPALVAASATGAHDMLDASLVSKALEAIAAGDEAGALDILKSIVAAAAGGEKPAEDEKPAEEKPADPPAEKMAAVDDEEEKPAEVAAASARLMRLSGKTSFVDAINEVETWRTSHIEIEASRAKLAKEQAALELGKRKENAITLTKLGAETPHTSGLGAGKLCDRLLNEPLAEQTARVTALLAAKGGKLSEEIRPPASAGDVPAGGKEIALAKGGTFTLSAREVGICGNDPAKMQKYAETRAGIRARNVQGV